MIKAAEAFELITAKIMTTTHARTQTFGTTPAKGRGETKLVLILRNRTIACHLPIWKITPKARTHILIEKTMPRCLDDVNT